MRYTCRMADALYLAKEYIAWHYGAAIRELAHTEKNFLWFGYHFFSIPLLAKTLFSPIFRLQENEARLPDIAGMLRDFIVTAVMRLVGFSVKIVILAAGFLFETALLILFLPALAFWLILAPLTVLAGAAGIALFL
ncbi:MAG: hypothetical protein AAB915_00790 [Patescibacteria group bacterium]